MSCHMPFKLWVKMPTCPATSQLSWEKPQSAWEADIAGLAEVLQTATLLSGWIEPKNATYDVHLTLLHYVTLSMLHYATIIADM